MIERLQLLAVLGMHVVDDALFGTRNGPWPLFSGAALLVSGSDARRALVEARGVDVGCVATAREIDDVGGLMFVE